MRTKERLCLSCQKPIHGRSDKKFCDDYCRNTFNNRQRNTGINFVRRTNNVLLKNRKILASLLPDTEDTARVHEERLLALGFRFRYHTHQYKTKKGRRCVFCYEYGYLPMNNRWYLLVREKQASA